MQLVRPGDRKPGSLYLLVEPVTGSATHKEIVFVENEMREREGTHVGRRPAIWRIGTRAACVRT